MGKMVQEAYVETQQYKTETRLSHSLGGRHSGHRKSRLNTALLPRRVDNVTSSSKLTGLTNGHAHAGSLGSRNFDHIHT
jgi:hypothetical protein